MHSPNDWLTDGLKNFIELVNYFLICCHHRNSALTLLSMPNPCADLCQRTRTLSSIRFGSWCSHQSLSTSSWYSLHSTLLCSWWRWVLVHLHWIAIWGLGGVPVKYYIYLSRLRVLFLNQLTVCNRLLYDVWLWLSSYLFYLQRHTWLLQLTDFNLNFKPCTWLLFCLCFLCLLHTIILVCNWFILTIANSIDLYCKK